MAERLYHIVAVSNKTGKKLYMTSYPMDHEKSCIMLGKITPNKFNRYLLEDTSCPYPDVLPRDYETGVETLPGKA